MPMVIQYAKQKRYGHNLIGSGWHGESARHSLAARGFHTGSKLHSRGFPPYVSPFSHAFMEFGTPLTHYYGRKARMDVVFSSLRKQGWQIRKSPIMSAYQTWEAWRGKNYILFGETDYHKVRIEKAVIVDKDVGQHVDRLFRKPYPMQKNSKIAKKLFEQSATPKKKFLFWAKQGNPAWKKFINDKYEISWEEGKEGRREIIVNKSTKHSGWILGIRTPRGGYQMINADAGTKEEAIEKAKGLMSYKKDDFMYRYG